MSRTNIITTTICRSNKSSSILMHPPPVLIMERIKCVKEFSHRKLCLFHHSLQESLRRHGRLSSLYNKIKSKSPFDCYQLCMHLDLWQAEYWSPSLRCFSLSLLTSSCRVYYRAWVGGAMYDRWRETIRLPWNGLKSNKVTGQTDDHSNIMQSSVMIDDAVILKAK